MDLTRYLLRLALLFRRPPSRQRLILIAIVTTLSLTIAAVEWAGLWPESWKTERVRMHAPVR
jgi:hypothetical protein